MATYCGCGDAGCVGALVWLSSQLSDLSATGGHLEVENLVLQ